MITSFIIWLVVGGICGWLASLIMRTDAQQGILMNIGVGILGAILAGWVLGKGNINQGISIEAFLWSLIGAIILLAVVNLVRKGRVR
ncbi:MAG TPA: GlsB/YeaQ/YmgE family stress response membrane protein [Sphingomicrobium sp.]|nr:GlsB/YeaQ/YmgE family stress response membrane protein [Sphingomicrobium sp.]